MATATELRISAANVTRTARAAERSEWAGRRSPELEAAHSAAVSVEWGSTERRPAAYGGGWAHKSRASHVGYVPIRTVARIAALRAADLSGIETLARDHYVTVSGRADEWSGRCSGCEARLFISVDGGPPVEIYRSAGSHYGRRLAPDCGEIPRSSAAV